MMLSSLIGWPDPCTVVLVPEHAAKPNAHSAIINNAEPRKIELVISNPHYDESNGRTPF
jgi:hypothetical protein